ncbi:MAG: Wzt carbohydrate-binding domain-containing protein [Candidatus Omnitrophica bacterium]|nr:Wzt carbohydrate-binding domain-containing protein [Candidatus Omnitrophota bacterium]
MGMDKGEIVGVIGRNGSGKSTLLNVIAGGLAPSEGEIFVEGRVSALLALGAGFNDEFTGKENIYLSASLLGLGRKDTEKVFNDIVDFSELGEFINAPLGSYSGGMKMRLGFSVAIHKDFDILVTDEVIAVGDMGFQKKCFERMADFKRQGKSMIIAAQDIAMVERLCDRVILLEDGRMCAEGSSQAIIEQYLMLLSKKKILSDASRSYLSARPAGWRDDLHTVEVNDREEQKVTIPFVQFTNKWGQEVRAVKLLDGVKVRVDLAANTEIDDFHFAIDIFREDGVCCYGADTQRDGLGMSKMGVGSGYFELTCERFIFMPGMYYVNAVIWDKSNSFAFAKFKSPPFEVTGNPHLGDLAVLTSKWSNSFFSFSLDTKLLPHLENLTDAWEKETNSSGVGIDMLSLLNVYGARDQLFHMGRELRIKTDFRFDKSLRSRVSGSVLWVGVYREDGIYCHGSIKRIASCGPQTEILYYPKLMLLPGQYRVSAGIWDANSKQFLAYTHGLVVFHVVSEKHDHGTVYLPHRWKWHIPKSCNE